ncbi:tRNA (5-methylaminomethyl-2-thiouridine)(34)-methyltransferase MnmD [Aestuariibius insulae]|uniref:tRNA (5-methylaminomethyl-2-thiouridine)(34)-methyltransferase MnmD n=1 Tax=Aestuariibius insulae TaxID=2058287 RepID=UPI00345EF440
MTGQIAWTDGTPLSVRFDDPYYSLQDGLAESEHVFLHGNRIEERLDGPLRVAELGFGTGLSFLALWRLWEAGPKQPLSFTSFELALPSPEDMRRALGRFPELEALVGQLLAEPLGAGAREVALGLVLEIIGGDARTTLPHWGGHADAWFLDGFSPAKNPELWEPDLMAEVGRHTAKGGTFATYTAAGHVRRALEDAGFEVSRVPGYGRKRHMSIGRLG